MWDEKLGYSGNTAEDVVSKLDDMDRSKGYLIIRDGITSDKLREIKSDPDLYAKFQRIKSECKQSYEYDHRVPTMYEVNTGLTNLYGVILKLLKADKSDDDNRFIQVQQSIDTIKKQIGMPITGWDGGSIHNDQCNDGKGIKTSN